MTYTFDERLAALYGVEEAIMINSFAFWIRKNAANGMNYHDGRFWTYNSMEAMTRMFTFWTQKQIRRILKSLQEQGVLVTGNYNKSPYDRTLWYGFSDSFVLNENFHLPKWENGKSEKGEPIPDILPNILPVENTSVYGDTHFFEPEKNSIDGTSYSVNIDNKEKVCAEKESDTVAVEVVEVRSKPRPARFVPPTVEEVAEYCRQRGNDIDPEHFVAAYQQSGWRLKGGAPMKDWRAAVINWEKYRKHNKNNGNNGESRNYDNDKGVRDAEFARYWAGRVGDKLV